jgi:hypothetical protein
MAQIDRGKRKDVVGTQVAASLTGDGLPTSNVVEQLVQERVRIEQESERKSPMRPTEERRRQRQLAITFSVGNEDVPDRLRDLAERWGLYANNGSASPSAVVEYLLDLDFISLSTSRRLS